MALLSLPLSECGFKDFGEEILRSLSQRQDGVRKSADFAAEKCRLLWVHPMR